MKEEQINSAKIYTDTLSPFTGFGDGVFIISAVKRMRSKAAFLNMPMKDRKCNIELYKNCRTRMLLEECNCVPWEVPGFGVRKFQKTETTFARFFVNLKHLCFCVQELHSYPDLPYAICIGGPPGAKFNDTSHFGPFLRVSIEG